MSETEQGQWKVRSEKDTGGDTIAIVYFEGCSEDDEIWMPRSVLGARHLAKRLNDLQRQLADAEKGMHVLAGGIADEREKVRELQTQLTAALVSNGVEYVNEQTERHILRDWTNDPAMTPLGRIAMAGAFWERGEPLTDEVEATRQYKLRKFGTVDVPTPKNGWQYDG